MVDAYEIGIELALQDGVSAGLEAVAKELAALDAAVAASSAGLMALVQTAGMAAEAVAAVGGVRVRVPVEPGVARLGVSAGTAEKGERRGAVVRDDAVSAVPAGERQRAAESSGPAAVAGAGGHAEMTGEWPGLREAELAPMAAPVVVVPLPDRAGEAGQAGRAVPPQEREATGPVRVVVRTENGPVRRVPAVARTEAAPGTERAEAAPVRPEVARAEVGRALPARLAATTPEVVRRPERERGAMPESSRTAAVAPVPEVRAERASPDMGGLGADRAVAPMRVSGAGGNGGGIVLLDGRLVGEWLMDRMARDAGRPGAGMTGFDPRQAPAWTPSGAV